ncbi:hypothetical protein DMH17_03365 [Raoultella planticola]|nr:hypothetical protein [Raoultella planticola]
MNIMAWLYAGLIMGGASCLLSCRRWRITTLSLCIIAGTFLLTLLCLLTPAIWRSEAILVAGAITGGTLFYLVLLQIPLTGKVFTQLLTILWAQVCSNAAYSPFSTCICPGAVLNFRWRDAAHMAFSTGQPDGQLHGKRNSAVRDLALRTGARCRIAIGAGMLLMGLCCMKASPRPDICHRLSAGFCCCVVSGGGWQDYCCS